MRFTGWDAYYEIRDHFEYNMSWLVKQGKQQIILLQQMILGKVLLSLCLSISSSRRHVERKVL
jgi:hypothetical protein